MQEGSGVKNLQTELNYLDSFKTYCKFSDLGFFLGVGQVGGGYLRWLTIVYMSSGMFWGKESSNRIEISWLVQDLLNFGVLGSLLLLGGGRWVGVAGGMWGCPNTCTCKHAHVYMYRNCKWLLTWKHPCLSCLTCMCVHVCVCMGHPLHTHPNSHLNPSTHHPPGGHPWDQ